MQKPISKIVPFLYGKYFNALSLINKEKAATVAFNVFCTVRKGRVSERQKSFLDDAKRSRETVAGHQIQVYGWSGSRETVLLVHGWESNSYRWRNLIKKLQESNFNILAFDAPGHGYSSGNQLYVPLYSECLQAVIEKYGPKHIVGHSVGGMALLYNDHEHQNQGVEKMVTIGSPSEFYEIMEHYQNFLGFNNRVMGALNSYIFKRFNMYIKDFSSSRFVASNTKKGLLFHDHLDKIAPHHASERVHRNWKDSYLVSTEGFGHSMHQEEVNDQIVNFLQT